MKQRHLIIVAFLAGYVASDLLSEVSVFGASPAKAEVAGMDSFDLSSDFDFRRAVTKVVSNRCQADGEMIICY